MISKYIRFLKNLKGKLSFKHLSFQQKAILKTEKQHQLHR